MREIDELYADSGEPVKESRGVSRGTALKVGGLGLAGALAAFLPGRAGASVRRQASNASCKGQGFVCAGSNKAKACGFDQITDCSCLSIYYPKLRPTGAPVGACVENDYCYETVTCASQKDCAPGFVCVAETCCGPPVCAHYCQQGSQNTPPLDAPGTMTHKGTPKKRK
jgi:hypothetical protein